MKLFNQSVQILLIDSQNEKKSKRNVETKICQDKTQTPSPTSLGDFHIVSAMNQFRELNNIKQCHHLSLSDLLDQSLQYI